MKRAIDRRQFGIGGMAATAVAAAGPAHAESAPLKIRVGWVVVPASSAPLLLEKKELLKNFGCSYVAEATRFEGTPPVITALAAGELDIGPLAFSYPKNHDEAVAIVARPNNAPPARMEWIFSSRDQYRDPNGMPNLTALQGNIKQQKEVGFLKDDLDVKQYSDLGMVDEAAKRRLA
jgi:ABC-type proline/glycine betaine transport system substrate-binding protein